MRSYRRRGILLGLLVWIAALFAVKSEPLDLDDATIEKIQREERQHETNCAYTRRVKRYDHSRFPSARPTGTHFGKAVRFLGQEVIRFTGIKIPSRQFTLDFWLKPEGGQQSPVIILGLFDFCSLETPDKGWKIGLEEAAPEKSLRLFFSLRTARSRSNTTLYSTHKVESNVWVHVAATYDGRLMKLYINQANVAVSSEQKGHLFAQPLMSERCEALEAGGARNTQTYFRGSIDEVKLWSVAKSHMKVSEDVFGKNKNIKHLRLSEGFGFTGKKILSWVSVTKLAPEIEKSTIPSEKHDLSITRPPCGNTVCDNPEVVRSYVNNTHLRHHKVLRFRVINVMDNDGRNPIVSEAQIRHQTQVLNTAFQRWNISWEMHKIEVRNTSLRRKTVLFLCLPSEVGDMRCHPNCDVPTTGHDGGDCNKGGYSKCNPAKRGNGQCDPECNRHDHAWDYGDCCNPAITQTDKTCFDPTSPHRAYISLHEYKTLLHLDNRRFLNVYFKQCGGDCGDTFQGAATFPWEKTVHSVLGGVLINPVYFGQRGRSNSLIHEFGHMLGLWHVHRGVSELKCTDECYEAFPSMELGDLCSDTNPTPLNKKCKDPSPKRSDDITSCGRKYFRDTPFNNYMSYSDDSCTNAFTPQQAARMHCYTDLVYQSWQTEKARPSFIPIPPRVTSETPGNVVIAWIPPLGTGGENAMNMCHLCSKNSILEQYAVSAYSPIPEKPNGYWGPHQAVGAPDAEPCILSPKAWNPMQKTPRSCPNCYIELGFKEAIVPTELAIWVTWHPKNGISDVRLIFVDGSFQSLGNATAQCDSPLTMAVRTDKKVARVRIYTYTSIDAVRLTSSVSHPNCLRCKPIGYLVSRDPPFLGRQQVPVKETTFLDRTVKLGKTYMYSVQAVTSSGLKSPPSTPLTYTPKRGFCGDGRVDKQTGEECDDGNVRDGDGCNVQCKKEDVFHCKGHPSLCYRHDGDGICEEFERMSSIQDCGFYTPDGFQDQWALNASANPAYQLRECPESRVLGPPVRDLVCKPTADWRTSWSPCGHQFADSNYWLEVTFKRPVVPAAVLVYLASDGRLGAPYNEFVKTLKVDLFDIEGQLHESGSKSVSLSCKTNPAIVPVRHDMTKKFYYTQKVRITSKSYMVAIAGVTLRSLTSMDPVALVGCRPDELYNPRTQRCHKYTCVKPTCPPLQVKRATVQCEGNKEGQRCALTCAQGYLPRRPFKMLCLHGKWKGAVDKCVPVDCGIPKIPNAKYNCPKGTAFGSRCAFRCVTYAKMTGKDNSLVCEEDGKWSAQQSFCIMTCAVPPIPPNSIALGNNCVGEKGKRFMPGMACKFQCKQGFRPLLSKNTPARKALKVRCTKQGKWTLNSHCVQITCQSPPLFLRHWYNCTAGNTMGSLCTTVCPDAKAHHITCGADGQWSRPFEKCKSAGSCGKPADAAGVKFLCNDFGIKAVCRASCVNRNHDAVVKGSEHIWGVSITCNSKLKWEPDPLTITCLKECRKDIGDGWCDERNNNRHCRWDGGDCCASTAKDRIVRRSPPHCGKACDCLDPTAPEITTTAQTPTQSGDGPDDDLSDDDGSPSGSDDDENGSPLRLELRPSHDETKQLSIRTRN